MALAYSYQVPAGYAPNPDIAGGFARGFQGVRSVLDELNAEQTLADLAKSATGGQQPTAVPAAQPPQSLSDLMQSSDPGNQMIAGSANAAATATDPTLAGYFKTLAQRESSNNPNATNPASSAGGLYQITDPTWQALVAQNPNSGLTPDGKMDPAQQQTAVRLLTQQNAGALRQAGQPVNPTTLYAAHLLGAPTATKVLGYADETPMASIVPPEDVQANPQLSQMTVGQFKAWAGQSGTNPQGGYAPPAAGEPMAPGLPSRDILTALLQNPVTREIGTTLLSRQIDPTYQLDLQGKMADNALKSAEARAYSQFGGKIPPGYTVGPNGGLMPVPGGPADPTNPLNYNKVNPFGQPTAPDGSGGAATADQVPVQLGPNGRPDPVQQKAYISTLPPNLQPLVSGVVNYTLDPNKVVSLKGNARTQLIAAAKAADPSFDMAQYPARAAMIKSLDSGALGNTLTSVNTTIQHLGELDNQVEALGNTSFTPFNAVKNAYESATGNPAQTTFAQTAQAAADEMAKFFKGAGASDVNSIRDWQNTLSSASSPDQLHAVIRNAVANLMQAKLNTVQEQYQKVMGGQQLPGFLSSQSLSTLSKMGINPATLDPEASGNAAPPPNQNTGSGVQEGATATNPATKQQIVFKGGRWLDAATGQPVPTQ
jgi:hypothetical protein